MEHLPLILLIFLLFSISALAQTNVELLTKNAIKLCYEKKYNEAIVELNKAIQIEPYNAHLYLKRAENFWYLKNTKSVFEDVMTAISLKPSDIKVLGEGAKRLILTDYLDEALKVADSIIKIDPSNSKGYEVRAEIKLRLKDYEGLIEDSLKAIEFMPLGDLLFMSRLRAILLINLKDEKNILNYYEKIRVVLEKRLEEANRIPVIIPNSKDNSIYKEKFSFNTKQSELFEHIFFMLYNSIKIYDELGQTEQANKLVEKTGQYKPQVLSLPRRASFYLSRKNYEKALADFSAIIEFYEELPNTQSNFLIVRGDVYMLMNQYEKAIADYESAIRIGKNNESKANEKIALAKQKLQE